MLAPMGAARSSNLSSRSGGCRWWLLGFALLVLAAVSPGRAAAEATLTAEVNRDHLVLGDALQLRITFRAEGMGLSPSMDFDLGEDFEVVARSSGRNIEMVNGRVSIASSLLLVLQPVRAGRLTIPALKVRYHGKEVASRPIPITVTQPQGGGGGGPPSGRAPPAAGGPSGSPSTPAAQAAPPFFLELTLSRDHVVVGEPVVATLYLYARRSLIDLDFATPPDFPDCWVEELASPKSLRFTQVQAHGRIYRRALLLSRLITPNRSGDLTLPAASVAVRYRATPRGGDPFTMLMSRKATKTVASPAVTLHVAPLPAEGRPAAFTGAVGRFTARAHLEPARARVGEPVKWVVTVRGTGNFQALKLPLPDLPAGLETFDTDRDCNLNPTAGGERGSCTFTTLVVARRPGDYTLPAMELAWFDPASGRYATATLPTFALHAAAAAPGGGGAGVAVGRRSVTLLRQEIHYLADDAALLAPAAGPWVARPLYWGAMAAPPLLFLAWGGVVLLRRRAGARRPEAVRRAALRQSLDGLRTASDAAAVRTLVESALAAVVGRPVVGLRREELTAALRQAGHPEGAVAAVAAVLDGCDAAAFAPGGADVVRLATEARTALAGLTCGGRGAAATTALLLAALLAAGVAAAAITAGPAGKIAAARAAYERGDYEVALGDYEALLAAGESGPRHYNAGCAAYQAGQLGQAIYHWERARYLDPHLTDAAANLEVARLAAADQVKEEEVPRLTWLATHLDLLAGALLAAWWGLALALFLALRRPRGERDGLILASVTLTLVVGAAGALLALGAHQRATFPLAICLPEAVTVRSGPGETFPEVFTLHAGAPTTLLTRQGDWVRIRLGKRLVGWLPASQVGRVAGSG